MLAGAVVATSVLVAAELLGGYLGHSISLVSDALHNLSDIPTRLLISWIALHWAARPADHERTYGYQRAGVLAAFTNAILLVLVSLGLFYEAFRALYSSRCGARKLDDWRLAAGIGHQWRDNVGAGQRAARFKSAQPAGS